MSGLCPDHQYCTLLEALLTSCGLYGIVYAFASLLHMYIAVLQPRWCAFPILIVVLTFPVYIYSVQQLVTVARMSYFRLSYSWLARSSKHWVPVTTFYPGGKETTDRAAMLDEILDYVKFLRLQVKVLSMSRLGGASTVAQLVADISLQSVEGDSCESRSNQHVWEKWSDAETEQEVAKLMEEDVGAAMQYLQSKSLCIMPVSLAALVYTTQQTEDQSIVKSNGPIIDF
ncbi:hypothetical protein HAX54_012477 [Datura stramonium]|uniref:Uncharacterized protein n=1 Tax=Datura stramonium TaxID=4076 RepID=A0ABS8TLG2_DATST|nr:hypothetical protein [Datura stramonium]